MNVYRCVATGRQIFSFMDVPRFSVPISRTAPDCTRSIQYSGEAGCTVCQTPLGETSLLLDDQADEYWQTYQHSEELSKRDRMSTATEIFGEFELLCNETHEGMASSASYLLGCHLAKDPDTLYPLMTTLGQPAYLVSGMCRMRPSVYSPWYWV